MKSCLFFPGGFFWGMPFIMQAEFNIIPIKSLINIFHRTRTNNSKIYMESLKTQNCQSSPKEREKS